MVVPMQTRCLTLVAAVLLAMSAQSLAQQSMEEVVVTATKRAESIQDVPMSVSVVSQGKYWNALK